MRLAYGAVSALGVQAMGPVSAPESERGCTADRRSPSSTDHGLAPSSLCWRRLRFHDLWHDIVRHVSIGWSSDSHSADEPGTRPAR